MMSCSSIETSTHSSRFTKQYWSAYGQKSEVMDVKMLSYEHTSTMGLLKMLSITDKQPVLKLTVWSWFLSQCRILRMYPKHKISHQILDTSLLSMDIDYHRRLSILTVSNCVLLITCHISFLLWMRDP